MKFTKTAVALAIAGIASAPMIASADTTLSGAVQIQLNGDDSDGSAGDPTINADDVLFGIATSHQINGGATGYGSLRVDMNRLSNEGRSTFDPGTPGNDEDDTEVTTLGSADSVYVGIKGGFGDFRFGEIPNAVEYGQVANDIFDVAGEINGGISYVGTFGPVGLIANFSPENNSDAVGVGAKFGLGGFSIGVGTESRFDADEGPLGVDGNPVGDDVTSTAVGVGFAFAGASINAHFWTQDAAGDPESFSVQAGYGFGGVFSTLEDDLGGDNDAIRLDLGYGLGGGMDISARVTTENDNAANTDATSYRIKLSKSF